MKRLLLALILVFAATFGLGAWYSSHEAAALQAERWQLWQAEDAADARLDQPIRLDGEPVTLEQFCGQMAAATGLEVTIDSDEVARVQGVVSLDEGRRPQTSRNSCRLPIGLFSVRSALNHVLPPLDLDYGFDASTLVVTTQDAIECRLRTTVYPLPQPMLDGATEDQWAELVKATIAPGDWDHAGGRGHLEQVPGALVIVHRPNVHQQLRLLLEELSDIELQPPGTAPRVVFPRTGAAARERLQGALARPASLACRELSLRDVLTRLADEHGIEIAIDVPRLAEAGVGLDQTWLTMDLANISLRSILRHLLHHLELALVDCGDSLLVTTPEAAEEELQVVAYPAHDLTWSDGLTDFSSLHELITAHVAPNSWDLNGPEHIPELGGWLIVSQTADIQRELASLLSQLRRGIGAGGEPAVPCPDDETPAALRLHDTLRRPIALEFDAVPLREVAQRLARELQINIVIDTDSIVKSSVVSDPLITWHMPAIPLQSQFYWMLRPLDLMWIVRDEALVITTTAEAELHRVARVYDLRSLDDPDLGLPGGPENVRDLIRTLVGPDFWPRQRESLSELAGLAVVSETAQGHDQLERLLAALEKLSRLQSAPSGESPAMLRLDASPSAERIERVLSEKISVSYCGVRLEELLRDLARRLELPVVFDQPAVVDEGFDFQDLVSITASERPLSDVLDELLAPTQYTFAVAEDVLFFTFKARRQNHTLTRLYCVSELLPGFDRAEISQLRDALVAVQPEYWADRYGYGVVCPVGSDWLAVAAPWRKQQEVAQWLNDRRNMRELRSMP